MDAIACIKARRSIRKFTPEPVTAEAIAAVLEAAAYAPSWKNTQTARYIVVTDADIKTQIAADCVLGHEGNRKIVSEVPMLLVQTTIEGRSGYERDGTPSTAKGTHWQSFDAGIAAQTVCLAAHAHGLGTVIMGLFDPEKIAALLSVPEGQSVSALIAVGHPAIAPEAPKRKTIDELVRWL